MHWKRKEVILGVIYIQKILYICVEAPNGKAKSWCSNKGMIAENGNMKISTL